MRSVRRSSAVGAVSHPFARCAAIGLGLLSIAILSGLVAMSPVLTLHAADGPRHRRQFRTAGRWDSGRPRIKEAAEPSGAKVRNVKRADLRWLAVLPIVVAVPFLFFGLIWQALVQSAVGVGLLVLAFGIWMLFAED